MNNRESDSLTEFVFILSGLAVLIVGASILSAAHYWLGLGWLASAGTTLGVAITAALVGVYYVLYLVTRID
jgi:hypothetical protein